MSSNEEVVELVPISLIGNRYLLFDVKSVMYLRRTYHICGTPIGTLPQIPQQNLFLGLPIELMKEEVEILTSRNIAYIVNDSTCHQERYGIKHDDDRSNYLESLKFQGLNIHRFLEAEKRSRTEKALIKRVDSCTNEMRNNIKNNLVDVNFIFDKLNQKSSNFQDNTGYLDDKNTYTDSVIVYKNCHAITPTTSYVPIPSQKSTHMPVPLPRSYALYKHLHESGYFILPGLRFGCHYNVYPGDPLRFHSHFIAVGYDWDQSIPTFDIIGGGRLGTAVKKGFLIGGLKTETNEVRTFAIEWAGM
ncbi:putative trna-splicing endonuclease subunit sen34 [Erysiphe necator]|uniref:tRNA-splicing endonuclease subunit Sen34 n=1 Tax=Uncinula necator TaxID=52586 RepID=A0A0B1PBF4_UNCNE|nr:putative trna-splicing endonuclease subunit sen34 [Erysiphe necator]